MPTKAQVPGGRGASGALLAVAVATVLLAWVLAHFGSEVLEGELRTVDLAVRQYVMAQRTPALTRVFQVITLFGGSGQLLIPVALSLGWLVFRDRRRGMIALLVCAMASAAFVAILKDSYRVSRPAGGLALSRNFSFPSGHTAGATSVWLFLAFVASRQGMRSWVCATLAIAIVVLIGISRVYLDMHWTSDVLGGWAVGTMFAIGSAATYEWIARRSARHPQH